MSTIEKLPELPHNAGTFRESRRKSLLIKTRSSDESSESLAAANAAANAADGNSSGGGRAIPVSIQDTTHVAGRDDDTFITQRAGKLVQTTNQIYIPVIPTEPGAGLESRNTLQATLLLQKKREMMDVQSQLDRKRQEFAKRMEECREKQEELRTKQKQIRDRVAKFEKFLKDNDAKRVRANSKALTERKIREQKEKEIIQLHKLLQAEQFKNSATMKLTNSYQTYEAYLQRVVDCLPPDYLEINEPHITDILARHGTLVDTAADLAKILINRNEEIEAGQIRLAALMKEGSDQVLLCNSMLGTKQKKLDSVRQQCAILEQRLEERDRTGKERMRTLGEAKLAINNLYDRVTMRSRNTINNTTTIINNNNTTNQNSMIPPVALAAEKKESGQGNLNPVVSTTPSSFQTNVTLAQKLVAIMTRLQEMQEVSRRAAEAIKNEAAIKRAAGTKV
ncbi:hypothetical protein SmJEL517_g00286 [Synchytrium microbalum]|uniref:DUF4200 domain-containing protein n=1 Tax=Synchytrium microbalum TaxID=1806994 RepID=A0A507CK58_9FUNG|nr:uncharacterized protein SmJEL517_g00286 [Synchytrium microbalum]TPX38275.1 hypothetical protein SmJEL517_g00286 [Synchytrium microbalum]